jgi:hypothetical protein
VVAAGPPLPSVAHVKAHEPVHLCPRPPTSPAAKLKTPLQPLLLLPPAPQPYPQRCACLLVLQLREHQLTRLVPNSYLPPPPRPTAWLGYNPFNAAFEGTDFFSEFSSPAIDFACIHMWHDQWMKGTSAEARLGAAKMWISGHEKACRTVLKKPLIIEEYGAVAQERAALFRLVRGRLVHI